MSKELQSKSNISKELQGKSDEELMKILLKQRPRVYIHVVDWRRRLEKLESRYT